MAIYSIYIGRVSNLADFVIGTPILNRLNKASKQTNGMFVSTVPLRINIEQNSSFIDFSKKIGASCFSMLRHQRYPYQCILEDLRKKDSNIPNLYNIILSYQITSTVNDKIDCASHWIFNGNCADDMQIHIVDYNGSETLSIFYDYKTSKYVKSEIKQMHERINHIIEQVLQDDSIDIENIEIVTPEEKLQILKDFNNTKTDYPRNMSVIELFENQVKETPNKVAVVFEDSELTYDELNKKANQLANILISNKVKQGDGVGIFLDKSLEMIVSILAILKCDAIYLPIDIHYPDSRINYIIENSGATTILTDTDTERFNLNTINVSLNENFYKLSNTSNILRNFDAEAPAYIMYTSGSTGLPKGVVLNHRSLVNLAYYLNDHVEFLKNKPSENTMISVTTSSFDIFIFETLICLQKGIKVVIADEEACRVPSLLNQVILDQNCNAIQMTPSRMQFLVDNKHEIPALFNLKYVVLAGEPLPIMLLKSLRKLGIKKVYNGYGPSETTVFSTFTDVTNYKKMTIGKPLSNTKIYLLDKDLNLVPQGVSGELYIAGNGVGNGYLNNLELTEKSFIKNPFEENSIMYKTGDIAYFKKDGNLVCLGRSDSQIKIRGLRVELR